MIDISGRGAHTLILSTLCARCSLGETGCCASPPAIEWSDLGRIVARGGRAFVLDRIADGSLRPGPRGLFITRVAPREGASLRCVFHGPEGCTLPPARRAATCDYYVCDDAIAEAGEARGDPIARRARRTLDRLVESFGRFDRALADRVRARFPEGPPWDAAFLDWVAAELEEVSGGAIVRERERS